MRIAFNVDESREYMCSSEKSTSFHTSYRTFLTKFEQFMLSANDNCTYDADRILQRSGMLSYFAKISVI